ncbi:glycosyltransferase family 4 protein [Actinocrinis puniceicyclus]|uniref:Glycosyltransferase family 4 protein n=1 Tax=Actinocrinis puniceicyclus TaxID=977794 RepID=A0A8J8BE07_9ACTN|nr:glycosyltransferase family 4 protein [Actinocrinis puniceicyclus]MBS2964716.1 glycosyltransferase family 4 protein [Actinocrinis puniceicyclus]
MRIAMVSAHYAPFAGGVESHVEEIAKRLAERGEAVEVLTHHDSPGLPDTETREGVLVRRYKVPVNSRHFGVSPAVWATLLRHRGRYDVVHAHGYHSAAPLAAAMAGASPMVFTPHYHGTGHSPLRKAIHIPYRAAGAAIAARSQRIICVSRAEADLFLTHFPSARPRVTVIPNGVDLGRITAARPFPDVEAVVITGGRLESYKQVDRIVEAMALTPPGLRLVVTGDGPERGRLEALADERAVRDRVSFIGRVQTDPLYRWYASAEVFCSMSSNEAMPVTILELLAAGARVVASDIPAHRDIRERTAGAITLVPLDADPGVLARALERAVKAAPAPAQRIPTWDEVTTQTLDVYRDVTSAVAVA